MIKNILSAVLIALLTMNLCGCWVLWAGAGAAGGVGTVTWIRGKLCRTVDAPLEKVVAATKQALKTLDCEITRVSEKRGLAQIRAFYTDKRNIWIDVYYVSANSSKIEIRVGAKGDEDTSYKILEEVAKHL